MKGHHVNVVGQTVPRRGYGRRHEACEGDPNSEGRQARQDEQESVAVRTCDTTIWSGESP
eukprot:2953566-Pyramimonas_sp.AAC.1